MLLHIFSMPFLSSSTTPVLQMLVYLVLSQGSLRLFSFLSFFFIVLHSSDFQYSVFQLTYSFFCLSYLLLITSNVFFIQLLFFFFFLFYFFARHFLYLLVLASILFLRSWIILNIITLNSFSIRLSVFI